MQTNLLIAAFVIFSIGTVLISRYLSVKTAFAIMSIKVSIPFAYFNWAQTKWTPYDGQGFQRVATELLELGYNPLSLLLDWGYLINYAESFHATPYWLSVTAQYFFGNYYFSSVFLNVGLTILIGLQLIFFLSRAGFSRRYYTWFFAFFLVQWEVLTWSSFVNVKGIFVTFLIVSYFYQFLMVVTVSERSRKIFHIFAVAAILVVLFYTRFYLIPIVLISSIGWVAYESKLKQKVLYLIVGTITLVPILGFGYDVVSGSRYIEGLNITTFLTTIPDFLLQPRPWGVNPDFSFLIPAAYIHWLVFVPASIAGVRLVVKNRYVRLFAIYLVVLTLWFSIFPDLASARMRFQLVFVFALAQFHLGWTVFTNLYSVRLDFNYDPLVK